MRSLATTSDVLSPRRSPTDARCESLRESREKREKGDGFLASTDLADFTPRAALAEEDLRGAFMLRAGPPATLYAIRKKICVTTSRSPFDVNSTELVPSSSLAHHRLVLSQRRWPRPHPLEAPHGSVVAGGGRAASLGGAVAYQPRACTVNFAGRRAARGGPTR